MPTLLILSGLPGSGKTTFAKQLLKQDKYLDYHLISSDTEREKLFGFRDQTRNKELWSHIQHKIKELAKANQNVILDSLALTQKDRRRTLSHIRKYFSSIECIQIYRPVEELIQTNIQRENTPEHIPEDVLKRKFSQFEPVLHNEGFTSVKYHLQFTNPLVHFSPDQFLHYNQDNPHHNETLGNHIKTVMRNCPIHLTTVAKYHDAGKPYTQQFNSEKNYHQYLGHSCMSSYIYITDMLTRLYTPTNFHNTEFYRELLLIKYHDLPFSKPDYQDLVDYFNSKNIVTENTEEFVKDLLALHTADKVRDLKGGSLIWTDTNME